MDTLVDTTFLVDLWREQAREGPAITFARANDETVLFVPWIVKGEFLRGALAAGHACDVIKSFLAHFKTVFPTEDTIRTYAEVYAWLKSRNQMIGMADLWIAASTLERGARLISRNTREFRRVPNLCVLDYTRPLGSP